MNRKLTVVVTLLVAAGSLSACGSTTGAPSAAKAGSNRPATTTVEPAPAAPAAAVAPVQEAGPLAFGATKTYTDGLSVTVSKGKAFKPSEYAAGKGKFYVKYTVTIVNGTAKMFDPSMFSATVQSGNVEGDQIFDSAGSIMGGPSTKLLKGREARFVIGFGVDNLKDVVLETRPSFDYDPAIYN